MLGRLCVQQEIVSFAAVIVLQIAALVFLKEIANTHYLKLHGSSTTISVTYADDPSFHVEK